MNLQAHAVSDAMDEQLAPPGRLNHLTGCPVDIGRPDPLADSVDTGLLRRGDQRVDLALPVGRLTENEGTGHVGVVAVDHRTEVQLDEIAPGQGAVRGPVMRYGGVLATG